jgi:hypothetical protein
MINTRLPRTCFPTPLHSHTHTHPTHTHYMAFFWYVGCTRGCSSLPLGQPQQLSPLPLPQPYQHSPSPLPHPHQHFGHPSIRRERQRERQRGAVAETEGDMGQRRLQESTQTHGRQKLTSFHQTTAPSSPVGFLCWCCHRTTPAIRLESVSSPAPRDGTDCAVKNAKVCT